MTVTTRRSALGILMGLAAGFAFGAGGTIVKPLFSEGWSPGAAVLGRLVVAAVVLAVPALVVVRFDLRPLLRAWRLVLAYAVLDNRLTGSIDLYKGSTKDQLLTQ